MYEMIDKEKERHIVIAYVQANIFVRNSWDVSDPLLYENLWLGAMGMLETLIINGVKAELR